MMNSDIITHDEAARRLEALMKENGLTAEDFRQSAREWRKMVEIHEELRDDAAYIWSVVNGKVDNMQMVLRAHGYSFDFDDANDQIDVARGEDDYGL